MSAVKVLRLGGERERELYKLSSPLSLSHFPLETQLEREKGVREEIFSLMEVLEDFRTQNGFGRGVAAPQIGLHLRLIALHLPPSHSVFLSDTEHIVKNEKGTFLMCNPEIFWRSEEMFTLWDDCMSFPDLLVKVTRHSSISLRWIGVDGKKHEWANVPQDVSELLQHEIDHLDGILAVDRAKSKEDVIRKEEYHKRKAHFDSMVDYVIAPLNG